MYKFCWSYGQKCHICTQHHFTKEVSIICTFLQPHPSKHSRPFHSVNMHTSTKYASVNNAVTDDKIK